jgi:hypothetical protein
MSDDSSRVDVSDVLESIDAGVTEARNSNQNAVRDAHAAADKVNLGMTNPTEQYKGVEDAAQRANERLSAENNGPLKNR